LRHYYAEQRFIELGTNVRAFDIIATSMGAGRQYLEAHYVRKGVMQDEDALVAAGGTQRTTTAGDAEVRAAYAGLDD
jgi:hypothetical protein